MPARRPLTSTLLLVALSAGTMVAGAQEPAAHAATHQRHPRGPQPQLTTRAVVSAPSAPRIGAGQAGPAPGHPEGCTPPGPDHAQAPGDGAPLLAVAPFRLDASRVALHHVDLAASNKVVSVPTRRGSKRVLKMVVGAAEVTDLRLSTTPDGPA